MKIDDPDTVFELLDCEVETLRRAALERNLPFDPERRVYTAAELSKYGMVREAYNSDELKSRGFGGKQIVTCFDDEASRARKELQIDAPFGSDLTKWQIPVDICEWRVFITEFPPNSAITPHVHPEHSAEEPGGSMRTVLKGALYYAGQKYGPGDWFYVPNGIPYAFTSDPDVETVVMYKYRFFSLREGNRFSHPISTAATETEQNVA